MYIFAAWKVVVFVLLLLACNVSTRELVGTNVMLRIARERNLETRAGVRRMKPNRAMAQPKDGNYKSHHPDHPKGTN